MQLVKLRLKSNETGIGSIDGDQVALLTLNDRFRTLSDILEADDPRAAAESLITPQAGRLPLSAVELLPPIDRQEVWAAGVTYRRSRTARMEESVGAASFYDKVYVAARPELFMKATPHRVVGPGGAVRIRKDARWNVPEPELALVLSSRLKLVGFTAGNDMSSRDIEGENPLYLPQAKLYNACCALGPCVTLAADMPPPDKIGICLSIRRGSETVFAGAISVSQMARTFDDLVEYLGRDNSFPDGAFLLTGTGIVPGDDFTLQPGDQIEIDIDGIGTLTNRVVQG